MINFAHVKQWFSGPWSNLLAAIQRRSQVLLFILVLFIGVASMALGAVSIKRSINAPFARSNANNEAIANGAEAANLNKDTDRDGLKDGDELNVYGTSPYLADSDSDGLSDGQEIADGTDPNCPKGKTCSGGQSGPAPAAGSETSNSLFGSVSSVGEPTVAELRDLLKNSGMPAADVDKLTDEQILEAYNQAVSEQGQPTSNSPAATAPPKSLDSLSASEVRQLLINSGIDKAQLEAVSDEDLMRIYAETLNEARDNQSPQ